MSLAIGLALIMIGVELFFVQELEVRNLRQTGTPATASSPFQPVSFGSAPEPAPTSLVKPPDWLPWSLLAVGSIIVIYTFTIPGRSAG